MPLKWRVRKKLGTEIKGFVKRNQFVKENPKRKGNKEQIHMRKNVKKKLGKYDLGLFPGKVSRRTEDLRLRVLLHSITLYTIRKKGVC